MRRVRRFLAALAVALLSVTPAQAQTQTGNIAGRVVDGSTMRALDGAVVQVGELSALSDAQGRFFIRNVPAGVQTLTASYLGFTEGTATVTVEAGETVEVTIRMTQEALALEGIVVIGYGEQESRELTGVVAPVTAEEFNPGRIVSPEQLIRAKVAGVQVVESGEPGGGISLRIRGGTSVTSSNEPLYVIDGVPLPIGGGISGGRNPLNFLNPTDIETITVLKDASATAIYGSRGANGVVIIETKQGRGEPELTYSGNMSGSQITGDVGILSTNRFREAVNRWAPSVNSMLGNASTDWRDQVYQSAFGQDHNITLGGGTNTSNYRVSLGYLSQEGIVAPTSTERISMNFNFNSFLFNEQLKITGNVKGAQTTDVFQPISVLGNATSFAPTQPVLDPNSPFGGYWEWDNILATNNPVAELNLQQDQGIAQRGIGNIQAEWALPWVTGLSATANVGFDLAKAERKQFAPSFLKAQAENENDGRVYRQNQTQQNNLLELFANYIFPVGENHNFDLTGGYSYQDFRREDPNFFAEKLALDNLGVNGVPSNDRRGNSIFVEESRLISFFGRANYSFADRYLVSASVRRDGSSKFGPEEQWGLFPSAAFRWRISNEGFASDWDAVNELSFRASWGVNGNEAIGNYLAYSDYLGSNERARVQFGNRFVPTLRPSAADPGIKWEETTSWNVGVDFALFDNRISGAVEYYQKTTDDLLFNVPVAAGSNLSNFVTTNVGSVENSGFEFTVNAPIFQDRGDGGFTWDASFNAAYNQNELTQINNVEGGGDVILTGGISGGVGNNIQILSPGEAVNSFYVYKHIKENGKPIYEDRNGDGAINEQDLYEDINGDGTINQDDRRVFGNPAPDWILGFNNFMTWKNFDLNFTIRSYIGNQVYNNVASDRGHWSNLTLAAPSNLHESVFDNEFEFPQYFSDIYVEDAGFIRMDNIQVGYTFDRTGPFAGARVFAAVQNVFTITGYSGIDPNGGVNGIDNNIFPFSRTFTAGVGFTF